MNKSQHLFGLDGGVVDIGFTGQLLSSGAGTWPPSGFEQFYMDFANNRAFGTTIDNVTTTRTTTNGTATAPDSNGNYSQFGNNVPRITSGRGLWSEEARTNLFLNSAVPVTQNITTVIGATYSVSVVGTGSLVLTGAFTGTVTQGNTVSGTALTTTLTVTTSGIIGAFVNAQVENNSLINSSVASAVPVAGGTGYVVGNTITLTGGTGTQAILTVTAATATAVTAVSVTSAGSYTVLPPSPAAQGSTSGIGTGATFTLTPTNNAAQGFATTPIITSGSAGARGADVSTVTVPPTFGSAYSIYAKGALEAPTGYSVAQRLLEVDDGTTANRADIYRVASTGTIQVESVLTGSMFNSLLTPLGPLAQGSTGKIAGAYQTGITGALNGTSGTGTATNPSGVVFTTVRLGVNANGNLSFNGSIAAIGINPTVALTGAQLQGATT